MLVSHFPLGKWCCKYLNETWKNRLKVASQEKPQPWCEWNATCVALQLWVWRCPGAGLFSAGVGAISDRFRDPALCRATYPSCCLPNGAVSLCFLLFDHDLQLIREWFITRKSLNVLLINSYTEINSSFFVRLLWVCLVLFVFKKQKYQRNPNP